MAKYMMTEPAFLPDGAYYEASLDKPFMIELPDGTPPSFKWVPLNDGAERDLKAHATMKIAEAVKTGTPQIIAERDFRVKPIPEMARKFDLPAVSIRPTKKRDPDEVAEFVFEQQVQRATGGVTIPGAPAKSAQPVLQPHVKGGKRASDQEPA